MVDHAYARRLRRRQKLYGRLLISCVALLPIGLFGAAVFPPQVGFWFVAAMGMTPWMAMALIIPLLRFAHSPCPRCGKPFHSNPGASVGLRSTAVDDPYCLHCGFSLDEDDHDYLLEEDDHETGEATTEPNSE